MTVSRRRATVMAALVAAALAMVAFLPGANGAFTASTSATGTWTARASVDPATLAGKMLWLRGQDLGANGASIASWPDQSGRNTFETLVGTAPVVAAASTPSGGKAATFSAGYFKMFDVLNTGTRASATAYNGLQYPRYAFDANAATYWQGGQVSTPQALRLDPPTPAVVTSYSVQVRPAADNQATLSPKAWTFEGSMNGSAWTVLDTQAAQTFAATNPGAIKSYPVTNTTAYTSYRIVITACAGGQTFNAPMVAEVELDTVAAKYVPAAAGEAWVVQQVSASGGSWGYFGTAGGASTTQTTGNQTEGFGVSATQSYTPSGTVTAWRIVHIVSDGTTFTIDMDGVRVKTVSLPVTWHYVNNIGNGAASLANYFRGNLAEVLVRDRVSTPTEVQGITAYLNAQHGLSSP